MSNRTDARMPEPPGAYKKLASAYPEVSSAYEALAEAVRKAGPLTEREIALVKLAFSVAARLEGGTHAHTRKSLGIGIEPDALRQVAILSAPTIGWPAMMASLGWVEDVLLRQTQRE